MRTNGMHNSSTARLLLCAGILATAIVSLASADPRLDSWFTTNSGKYARIYTNAAARAAGNSTTTWSNGSQNQTLPAYCGPQEILSSSNWVYIRSTGLGSHVMGPWSVGFPNLPANTHTFYRLPRLPAVPASKTLTGLGAIGYFVDGVAMFDSRDGFFWNGTTEAGGGGAGYWNRDAYVNEGATFDPAYAHQEQTGTYHYHANPIALRYLMGDNVLFDPTTKAYSENTSNNNVKHSPILGWVRDGFPIYGPYGYSSASNAASTVRRMVSGFVLRNGQNGSDNLTSTGRSTIPAWAVRFYGVGSSQSGPVVSTTYPLGRYMEDNVYLGDLGFVQGVNFDLDEYNGRFCVTPEFPNGTYAYFVSIASNGVPSFPYNIGRAFYGSPSGSTVSALTESVTTNFTGGASMPLKLSKPLLGNNTVTLVWSAVEGGSYRVESSSNLSIWGTNALNIPAVANTGSFSAPTVPSNQCFRVARSGLANFDSVTNSATGGGTGGITSIAPNSGTRGNSVTATITLSQTATPAVPPINAPVNSVSIGSINGTSITRPTQYTIQATFSLVGAAPGQQTVTVIFPGPPGNPTQTVTYTLNNGFTVQ